MRPTYPVALLSLTLALLGLVLAQSADAGSARDGVYTSEFFKLTWEFPSGWAIADNSDTGQDIGNHPLLRLRPSGPQSVEYLQLGFSEPDSKYEETLKNQMEKKGWEAIEGQGYYTLGGGVPAHRYDFRSKQTPTRYLAIAVGPWHAYALSVASVAESPSRTQELIKAALTMQIRPDWPPDGQAAVVPLTLPGSRPTRVRVSQGVAQVLSEHKVQPIYPKDAKKAHIQGTVVMLTHISMEGTIENLYVQSGNPVLVPAAIEAVSRWQYRPYLLNGKPVELETQITVNFTLN